MKEFFFGKISELQIPLNRAGVLFSFLFIILLLSAGFAAGKFFSKYKLGKLIKEERKKAVRQSRAVIEGQCAENFAPFLPDFPGEPSEAHFLGKPVDYIVFSGSSKEEISEIIFVEIKTGTSALTRTEKSLKEAVKNKKISWKEVRLRTN